MGILDIVKRFDKHGEELKNAQKIDMQSNEFPLSYSSTYSSNDSRANEAARMLGFRDIAEYEIYDKNRRCRTGDDEAAYTTFEARYKYEEAKEDEDKHPIIPNAIDIISEVYFGDTVVGFRFKNNTDDILNYTAITMNTVNGKQLIVKSTANIKPKTEFVCNRETVYNDIKPGGIWANPKYCKNVAAVLDENNKGYFLYKGIYTIKKEKLIDNMGWTDKGLALNIFGDLLVMCKTKYKVIARIMNGKYSDGYRVISSSGQQFDMPRKEFMGLCKANVVVNAKVTLDKDNTYILNGVDCKLNKLPTINT